MRLSFGKAVAALLASQAVEGSFLRDVVGVKSTTEKSVEQELLAKAIPLDDYRANLRARGYDIVQDSRRLDQAANMDADDYYLDESYMYSFSGYSLKYAACQPVQKFSEEAVSAGEYTPMITDDIVILRLCPSSSCSSNRVFGCLYNYAEYAVAVNDYVRIMLRYKMDKQEQLCNWCNSCEARRALNEGEANQDAEAQNNAENANEGDQEAQNQGEENQEEDNADAAADEGDDGVNGEEDAADEGDADQAVGDDGSSSGYVNDDDNGEYSQGDSCYKFKSYCYSSGVSVCAEDNDDGGSYLSTEDYLNYMECTNVNGYYLRPRCNGYDSTISMGIFYDKFCSQYAGDKVNMNSLGLGISPNAFQDFYGKSTCLDCAESNVAPYFNANANMCNRMHRSSARCTTSLQYDLFDSDTSNETTSCSFIESLRFGTYDQEGRLYTEEFGSSSHREMTAGQKWGLGLTIAVCVYLAIYSCYLHHAITNLLVRSLSHTELLPPRSRQRKARSRSSRRQVESDTEEESWKEVKKTPRRGSGSTRR